MPTKKKDSFSNPLLRFANKGNSQTVRPVDCKYLLHLVALRDAWDAWPAHFLTGSVLHLMLTTNNNSKRILIMQNINVMSNENRHSGGLASYTDRIICTPEERYTTGSKHICGVSTFFLPHWLIKKGGRSREKEGRSSPH